MSDERFDQDLRSVLLEDAPRDVPDDLRHRVTTIPDRHPVASRPSRSAWRRPVLMWAAALTAVAVVLAVSVLQFGPDPQPGIGSDPSPTPPPSSTPSPIDTSGGEVGGCLADDLDGQILAWQGAAGSRIAEVQITNTTARPCFIQGTPGLELVDAGGRVLIDSAAAGPSGEPHVAATDPVFELAPDGQLGTEVQASNYCGPPPEMPIAIAVRLPAGGGRLVVEPDAGVSSADAVPPCLGAATDAQIAMNGWRR
jgi:hypothetical protein